MTRSGATSAMAMKWYSAFPKAPALLERDLALNADNICYGIEPFTNHLFNIYVKTEFGIKCR